MGQTLAMVLDCPAPDAMPPGPRSRDEAKHSQRLVTDLPYLSGWLGEHIFVYPAITGPWHYSAC